MTFSIRSKSSLGYHRKNVHQGLGRQRRLTPLHEMLEQRLVMDGGGLSVMAGNMIPDVMSTPTVQLDPISKVSSSMQANPVQPSLPALQNDPVIAINSGLSSLPALQNDPAIVINSGLSSLPAAQTGSVSKTNINLPVPSQTEVIVAVNGDDGLAKLAAWSGAVGEGSWVVNYGQSQVLFRNQGLTFVELPLATPQPPETVINMLADESFVAWASPNMVYEMGTGFDPREFVPNDPRYTDQWHHPLMGNTQAWDTATTMGQGMKVAVLDDGVTLNHEDLSQNIWVNAGEIPGNGIDDDGNGYVDDTKGWDFSSGDNNPNPVGTGSHGTPVAGNIAARVNNGVGLAGVAGMATLMPVRFYGSGAWTSLVVAESYVYAVDNGANILNVSYNIDGFATDPLFNAALDYVYDTGAIYMNSAGNNGQLNPARGVYDQGLFVMASSPTDKLLSYSNYGINMDIVAPADPVWTTSDTGYTTFNGTSSATPVASGAMALVWAANPTWTRDQVIAQVLGTAQNIDTQNPALSGYLGYGRIDTLQAVSQTISPPKLGAITGLPAEGTNATSPFSEFSIRTASIYDASTVVSDRFEMRYSGLDGILDTADDEFLPLTVTSSNGGSYKYGTNGLEFTLGGSMKPGYYRFSALSGANGILDPFGQQLDGNGDGIAGDDLTRTFSIIPSISGQYFSDLNDNGLRDTGEPAFAGISLYADLNNNNSYDPGTLMTTSATGLPIAIPDASYTTHTVSVSGVSGRLSNITVRIQATHTWSGDLQFSLVNPSGVTALLYSDPSDPFGTNFNVTFDDNASSTIISGIVPSGTVRPQQQLANLMESDPNGVWTLYAGDQVSQDTGSLTGFSITFLVGTEPISVTDSAGQYAFFNLPAGDLNIIALNPPAAVYYVSPAAGVFSTTLTSGQFIQSANFVALPTNSISGQVTDIDTNMGVGKVRIFDDLNGNGIFDYVAAQKTSATNRLSIRDLKTVSKTLNISGLSLPVAGVQVTVDIRHRHIGDLVITLISPSGIRTKLLNREGGRGQNLNSAIFEDYADSSLPVGLREYTGSYIPSELLSKYNGANPNGTWTLEITDQAIGDIGWFKSFGLNFITSLETTTVTNSLGFYSITQVAAGNYSLRAAPIEPGWNVVTPGSGALNPSLTSGSGINGQNFALKRQVTGGPNSFNAFQSDSVRAGNETFYIPTDLVTEIAMVAPATTNASKKKQLL